MSNYENPHTKHFSTTSQSNTDSDLVKWELDSGDVIEEIKAYLLGVRENDDGKLVRISEAMMSSEGVNKLISTVFGRTTKITILAELDMGKIMDTMRTVDANLSAFIYQNYDTFKISRADRDDICDNLCDIIFHNLTRALDGNTRKSITEMVQRHEQVIHNDQEGGRFKIFGRSK